jgi:transposase
LDQRGSKGKGKKEQKRSAYNSRTVETTILSAATSCDICGEDLTSTSCHQNERRTKIDIVFEKVVEHVDAEIKNCPSCSTEVKGTFPADLHGPLQYGNGLKAYVINQLMCQMVALNRVQKSVTAMIGQTLSEATLLKFIMRLHEALADWEVDAMNQLIQSPLCR